MSLFSHYRGTLHKNILSIVTYYYLLCIIVVHYYVLLTIMLDYYNLMYCPMQVRFDPSGLQYKTMKSMDRAARLANVAVAMMPDYEMYCVDLTEGY